MRKRRQKPPLGGKRVETDSSVQAQRQDQIAQARPLADRAHRKVVERQLAFDLVGLKPCAGRDLDATVGGAVIGAFIMGVMNNGMSILGIGIDYQQVIKGLVLLAAVIFDVMNKKKG